MKSETNASNYTFTPVPNFSQKVLCKPSIRAGELDKAIGDAQVVSLVTWSCTFHHLVRGPKAVVEKLHTIQHDQAQSTSAGASIANS